MMRRRQTPTQTLEASVFDNFGVLRLVIAVNT